jgi:hypothetical protein
MLSKINQKFKKNSKKFKKNSKRKMQKKSFSLVVQSERLLPPLHSIGVSFVAPTGVESISQHCCFMRDGD